MSAKLVGSAIQKLIETIAAQRSTAKFLFACGLQLITILVLLSRALINPCGSTLTITSSAGIAVSKVMVVGTYFEARGEAEGDLSFAPARHERRRCAMSFAINWRLSIKINANARATLGSAIQKLIETIAAQRSTAKFLFACGRLLITILVLLARAL